MHVDHRKANQDSSDHQHSSQRSWKTLFYSTLQELALASSIEVSATLHSVRFACLVRLGSEIGGSRSTLGEEAGENWLNEGSEDDLSTAVVQFSYVHS